MKAVLVFLFLLVSSGLAQDRPPILLPADPTTPVITLAYRGGGPQPPPLPGEVRIQGPFVIRADGRGSVGNIPFSLSAAEVQDLLHFVIDDQHFFDFNPNTALADIKEEQRRTGRATAIYDAGTTVLRITTATKNVESSFEAVFFWSRNYPNARGLTQFAAIEKRLNLFMEEVKAGGASQIRAALDIANAYIKANNPDLTALTTADFVAAPLGPYEKKTIRFSENQTNGRVATVSVEYTPNTEPKVTVR